MAEIIGLCAAVLTTACYIPQAWHVIRERNTAGISLLAYSALFCGVALWFVYGIFRHDWPLMLANGISLPLLAIIIFMKVTQK